MKVVNIKRIFNICLLGITLLMVLIFLLASLAPAMGAYKFWWTGFAGLLVPYLAVLLVFSLILCFMVKPVYALFPLFGLILGWKQIMVIFAFHPSSGFSMTKSASTIRIVDWNIRSFNGLTSNKESKRHVREELASSVISLNPDVICLQEFNHSDSSGPVADNISLFHDDYPYYFFSKDYKRNHGHYQSGCIIFSKYPIVHSKRIPFPVAESLIYTDLKVGRDTVRIYTTHLQSFKFVKKDYNDFEKIKEPDQEALSASGGLMQKMKLAFKRRAYQADTVASQLRISPYPSVICGDFNDVPTSYAYYKIRGNRRDAFLEKGFGIGRSYIAMAPTLRIDYILPDPRFIVNQFDMVDEGLSDHILLVSDIRFKKF